MNLGSKEKILECLKKYFIEIGLRKSIYDTASKKLSLIKDQALKIEKEFPFGDKIFKVSEFRDFQAIVDINYDAIKENLKYFNFDMQDLQENKIIYGSFKYLCKVMNNYAFKTKERAEVIKYIISCNNNVLKNNETEENLTFSEDTIYDLIDISLEKLRTIKFMKSKEFEIISDKEFEELTEKEKEILRKSKNIKDDYCQKIELLKVNIQKISELYSKKIKSLDDIGDIYNLLIELGIDTNISVYMKNELLKEFNKNIKENTNIYTVNKNQVKNTKHYITDSEYKKIRKEIRNYFDFYKVKLMKDDITYEEIIKCAKMANKIGINDMDISRFFNIADLNEKQKQDNPISTYVTIYNKLYFYKDKYQYYELLNELKFCLEEMMITSDEDYIEWKKMFEDILERIMKKLSYSYEYELSLIKSK